MATTESPNHGTGRFTDHLQVRCPPALTTMLETAAARETSTPSDYVRRAVASRLRADGFEPGGEA